jgi:S1-C subfamily serine protease
MTSEDRIQRQAEAAWVGRPPLPNVRGHPVLVRYFEEWNLRPQYGEEEMEFLGARVERQATAPDFAAVGLLPGDLIVAIDGRRLDEWFDWWHEVAEHPDPRTLSWTIIRADQAEFVTSRVGTN